MKTSAEVHGVELIQRFALEKMANEKLKSRVWSDTMQCWGFFNEPITAQDVFLVLGAAEVGDMFLSSLLPSQFGPYTFLTKDYEPISEFSSKIPYVVLGKRQFELRGNTYIALELLLSSPMNIYFLAVPQRILFEAAWKF